MDAASVGRHPLGVPGNPQLDKGGKVPGMSDMEFDSHAEMMDTLRNHLPEPCPPFECGHDKETGKWYIRWL